MSLLVLWVLYIGGTQRHLGCGDEICSGALCKELTLAA